MRLSFFKKPEFLILVLLLLLAAILRLYQIEGYMTFLGDEGRDSLIVKRLLTEGDIPFIGPTTSVGNIYTGPLYYYMMAVSMVGTLSPVAAAVMNALIGVGTVYLVYWFTRKLFNAPSGFIAAFLYAISPVNIIYSRSSWNPNPAPLFTLLSFIVFYKFHETKNIKWMFILGILLGGVIQMHFITLTLLPIFMILTFIEWRFEGVEIKTLLKGRALALLGFLLMQIPWILFEIKHGFPNIKGLWNIFFGSTAAIGGGSSVFQKIVEVLPNYLLTRYLGGNIQLIGILLSIIVLGILYWHLKKKVEMRVLMLALWLILGVIGVSLYKGNVYDHYLGFIAPAAYIILGSLWFLLKDLRLKLGFLVLVAGLVAVNLLNSPLNYSPNNQLQRTQDITKYVIEQTQDKDFNFALLAKNNYDSAYQFYFEVYGHKPKIVPVQRTEQLFVVCEDNPCEPINNPKYEIAAFGMSKVESVKDFQGIKVYKLVANPSGKPS